MTSNPEAIVLREHLINSSLQNRQSYNGIRIGTYTRPIQRCHFEWPWPPYQLHYLQRNMSLIMLIDLAVFWLYVTLICFYVTFFTFAFSKISIEMERRVGRGSHFVDPTHPDPQVKWPNPKRPKIYMKLWTIPIMYDFQFSIFAARWYA